MHKPNLLLDLWVAQLWPGQDGVGVQRRTSHAGTLSLHKLRSFVRGAGLAGSLPMQRPVCHLAAEQPRGRRGSLYVVTPQNRGCRENEFVLVRTSFGRESFVSERSCRNGLRGDGNGVPVCVVVFSCLFF